MLGLGTSAVEYESVPIEIAKIDIGISARLVRNDPRTGRIFRHIVTAILQHLHLLVGVCPRTITFQGLVKIVGQGHIVVTAGHEIGRRGIGGYAIAAVVGDLRIACATALGGNQDNTRGCLCTINGAGRSILQHGNAFNIVRVHLSQRALDSIHEDERGTAVQR